MACIQSLSFPIKSYGQFRHALFSVNKLVFRLVSLFLWSCIMCDFSHHEVRERHLQDLTPIFLPKFYRDVFIVRTTISRWGDILMVDSSSYVSMVSSVRVRRLVSSSSSSSIPTQLTCCHRPCETPMQ